MSQSSSPLPSLPASPDPLPSEAARALADLLREGRVVAHQPCFARLFGGAACGILLSQFWFWTGTPTVQARTGGWFWKPQREITDETGLSRAETETARRRLCAAGVLEEKRSGLPATMHFRVNVAAVMRAVWRHLQAQEAANKCAEIARTALRGMRTLVRGSVANKLAGIAQSISESTSEIISEKTQEMTQTQTRARPAARSVFPSVFGERGALGAIRLTASESGAAATGVAATGVAAIGAAAIGAAQQAVNLSGAARFKAALGAARRAGPRPNTAAGRAPPAAVG